MKHIVQHFSSAALRQLAFALVCLLLLSVFFAARIITDDIASIFDHSTALAADP